MAIKAYGISFSPLTVNLSTMGQGGLGLLEIWVKDADSATFTVKGSHDGKDGTWRLVDTFSLPHKGANERHKGYLNAYQFIRVSSNSETETEIEIVAGET